MDKGTQAEAVFAGLTGWAMCIVCGYMVKPWVHHRSWASTDRGLAKNIHPTCYLVKAFVLAGKKRRLSGAFVDRALKAILD
jgi:hypothetical protein